MTGTAFSNVIRGVAYGDAWGDPIEFQSLDNIVKKNGPKGPDLPEELRITDDTQMSLFLADALDLTRDGSMEEIKTAIIEAFLDYYHDEDTHSRAPGVTVMGSLGKMAWQKDKDRWDWKAATNSRSDGSGTVMRTSPVAFVPDDRWVGIAAFAAAVTHGAANGIAAAILNVAILRELLDARIVPGELVGRALELAEEPEEWGLLETGDWLEGYSVNLKDGFDELARLLRKAAEALPRFTVDPWINTHEPSYNLIGGGGNGGGWRAHETLVIALMDVDMFPGDAWSALRRAAVSDGDSDTIGAVAGGLLGAAYDDFFIEEWVKTGKRFEPRYIRWIENEADDYVFGPFDPEAELVEEIEDIVNEAEEQTAQLNESQRTIKERIMALFSLGN